MTTADFLVDALSFPVGNIVVVSGQDLAKVQALLFTAQSNIESSTSNMALVFDSRSTIIYPERMYQTNVEQARVWEYMAIMAEGKFVLLVSNQFDPADRNQNPEPRDLVVDVLYDLFSNFRVQNLQFAFESKYGITREMFPFICKIYFYDTNTDVVTHVRDQRPFRP